MIALYVSVRSFLGNGKNGVQVGKSLKIWAAVCDVKSLLLVTVLHTLPEEEFLYVIPSFLGERSARKCHTWWTKSDTAQLLWWKQSTCNPGGRRSTLPKVALLHAMGAAVLQPGGCTHVWVRESVLKSEELGFVPFIIWFSPSSVWCHKVGSVKATQSWSVLVLLFFLLNRPHRSRLLFITKPVSVQFLQVRTCFPGC